MMPSKRANKAAQKEGTQRNGLLRLIFCCFPSSKENKEDGSEAAIQRTLLVVPEVLPAGIPQEPLEAPIEMCSRGLDISHSVTAGGITFGGRDEDGMPYDVMQQVTPPGSTFARLSSKKTS